MAVSSRWQRPAFRQTDLVFVGLRVPPPPILDSDTLGRAKDLGMYGSRKGSLSDGLTHGYWKPRPQEEVLRNNVSGYEHQEQVCLHTISFTFTIVSRSGEAMTPTLTLTRERTRTGLLAIGDVLDYHKEDRAGQENKPPVDSPVTSATGINVFPGYFSLLFTPIFSRSTFSNLAIHISNLSKPSIYDCLL